MEFTVKDWMVNLVVFIDPSSTVMEALTLMRRRYIHSLIVNKTNDNPEYGIITSTDISDKIVALDKNPTRVLVREIMTSPFMSVTTSMSLKECAAIMNKHSIHHLPVADEGGNLVGLISDTDFLVAAEAMGRAPGERLV